MTDPTNIIDTRERAAVLAHAMLRLAPNPAPQGWQSTSQPMLCALLYAASPVQAGHGIGWVNGTVAALASDKGDAARTAGISDAAMARVLSRLDGLHDRQRATIIKTLRDAVNPWLAVG